MLDYVILGIVQGATEFLPISSSGHLYLFEHFLGMTPDLNFKIWLHTASLLAVLLFFYRRIWELLSGIGQRPTQIFVGQLLVSTILTVPIALMVRNQIGEFLDLFWVGVMLLVTAAMIGISVWVPRIRKNTNKFSWWHSIGLGIVQGFTALDGISRSGTTIAYLLTAGIPRARAVEISFLLAIPTILGALVFSFEDVESASIFLTPPFLVAGGVSFLVALGTIYFMLRWIERYWGIWGIYAGVLGLGLCLF